MLAAWIAPPSAASAASGPGADAHYFLMTAASSGQYSADYGNDRLEPGLTTSFGVDGTETGSWSWKIRAVGRSVGNGPLRSVAAEFKGRARHSAELISYTIQMGVLDADELCEGAPAKKSFTHDKRGPLRANSSPRWLSSPATAIQYRSGGFAVGYPGDYDLLEHCYHGLPRGLQLYSLILPTETSVPRGVFNPRSDRSFSDSWDDAVSEIEGAGGAQEHLDTASVKLTITVKAISERKAIRKRDKFRAPDPLGGIYGFG